MRQWLAPWPCKVLEASAEARPGGRYRIVVAGPLGGKTVTAGEYLEVTLNQRLVQTWVLEGKNPAVDPYPTLLTVDFRKLGARSTEITLRQEQLLTAFDRAGNRAGWRSCFKKLDVLLNRE